MKKAGMRLFGGICSMIILFNLIFGQIEAKALDPSSVLLGNNVTVYSTYMYTNSELRMLTSVIYGEAGNQPFKGQVAVGNVVMNRVKSPSFPNTVKAVLYAPNQFDAVKYSNYKKAYKLYKSIDKISKRSANYGLATILKTNRKAAKVALGGKSYIGNYVFYARYDCWLAEDAVADPNVHTKRIKDHVFFDTYPRSSSSSSDDSSDTDTDTSE